MLTIRPATERGHGQHGWLDTRHTFSFNDYHDPRHMGFRVLRVMNEDRVQPGEGFGTHGHRDMEIISYVLAGALEHRDSLGTGSVLRPGEFQRMTAGTGITHSEFNPSPTEIAHFYQIWLRPRERGLPPGYEQKVFPVAERQNRLRIVASPDGRDGSLTIQQDAEVYLAGLDAGVNVTHAFRPGRSGWLQVLSGNVVVGEHRMQAGDGVAISDEALLAIHASSSAEVMLLDLP